MDTTSLLYYYHLDRFYFIPFIQIYQSMYGVAILPLHAVAFYLLICHTKNWATSIKTGYILSQSMMPSHDIWTSFLFRAYAFLPNPIVVCMGPACRWVGPYISLQIEHIFMVHSTAILFYLLLMMQQQVAQINHTYVLPNWVQLLIVCLFYALISMNAVFALFTSGDVPGAQQIIERQQLDWLRRIGTACFIIFGEVGYCGAYTYG
ncbi:hypothetical protein PMAYCL1PPCAC_04033, partial [Pristionchus mayeri]